MTRGLCNIFKNSASAIEAMLTLHFPYGSILDANFGMGTFYRKVDREIVGVDLLRTGAIVANNQRLPIKDNSFDIGVCDPPYKRGDGMKYESRYGVAPHTEQKVTRLYKAAIPELIRTCRQGLIIKIQDGTDGHRFYDRRLSITQYLKELTGLEPHDIAMTVRYAVPSAMAQGNQHFFQNGISYFVVYKWLSKSPFKPVRF